LFNQLSVLTLKYICDNQTQRHTEKELTTL